MGCKVHIDVQCLCMIRGRKCLITPVQVLCEMKDADLRKLGMILKRLTCHAQYSPCGSLAHTDTPQKHAKKLLKMMTFYLGVN